MNKEQVFSVAIRVVFLFAFGAFLFASIHHIATFFDNFEQDSGNWFGSYALAISIDATALVLTIGVMFFRKNMPWYAQVFVWFFIIALTAFSWFVNWEYALRFQSDMLTNNDTLKFINPILASSFAFLNLAYSLVSEFFSARVVTADDLEEEAKRLESLISVQNRVNSAKEQLKKPSLIQRAKGVVLEVKDAAKEVATSGNETDQGEVSSEDETEVQTEEESVVIPSLISHPEPVTEQIPPRRLGMIEQVMFDKIVEQPAVLAELAQVAQSTDITGLTSYLKTRFSSHSNYITEDRVTNVFQAVQSSGLLPDHPSKNDAQPSEEMDVIEDGETEVFQEEDEQENEPSTDPEMEAANVTHFPETGRKPNVKTTVPLNVIDIATRRKPLTLLEAVQVLGVSEKTVREWKRSGKLSTSADGKLLTVSSVRKMLESRVKVS